MKTPSPIIVLAVPDNERPSGRLNAKRIINKAIVDRFGQRFANVINQGYSSVAFKPSQNIFKKYSILPFNRAKYHWILTQKDIDKLTEMKVTYDAWVLKCETEVAENEKLMVAYYEQSRKEKAFEEILKQEYPQAHPNNRNHFNYLGVYWQHTVDKNGFISFNMPYIEIDQNNWLTAQEIIKNATEIYEQSINKYEGTNINDFIA